MFCLDKDWKAIIKIATDENQAKASISAALDALVAINFLVKTSNKDFKGTKESETFWYILAKPLQFYNQNVEITFDIAANISNFLNGFNNPNIQCDPLNIKAKNLADLVFICYDLLRGGEDEEDGEHDIDCPLHPDKQ